MRIASGFWVFFTGLALAGCGGDSLDGLLRTGPSDPRLACPSKLKTWDLGTGRASDIARLAPDFFTKDNGGARYRSLQPNVPGLSAIKPAIVGGVDGFEFMTPEPSYRVRALLTDMGTILLATPGQCAHLQARERCVDDRLHTEVDARGKVACLGSTSVPGDSVMITLDGSSNKLRLVFGEPLSISASHADVSFDIFVPGADQPAGHVTRRRDDASDPLPEELVALLKASALEKSATSFYKGLQDSAKTPELDAEVVRLRIEGAKRVAARYDDPTKLVEMIRLHTVTVMPGDDEVLKVLSDRIAEVLPHLADSEVDGDGFRLATVAFVFHAKHSGKPIALAKVEATYGPKLTTSWAKNRDLQQAFATMFPDSPFVNQLEQANAKEAETRRQDSARQAQEADEQALWDEVQSRGDEIATLAYKIQFGRRNFVPTRHNLQGLASMQKYKEGLVREAFCPARAAFVKAKGHAEYNRRSSEHCKDSAPVDVGVGGVEKTLTSECRAAFATGC